MIQQHNGIPPNLHIPTYNKNKIALFNVVYLKLINVTHPIS